MKRYPFAAALLLGAALWPAAASAGPGFPAYLKTKYDPFIRTSALRHGIDAGFVHAVILAESAYNRWAISTAGAQGLMQLMPSTAAHYGVEDVFEPSQNIEGGVRYIKDLNRLYDGRMELVLAAYNAGQSAVEKYDGIPPYKETRAYIEAVQTAYRKTGRSSRTRLFTVIDAEGRTVVTNDPRLARRKRP